jgi:hypothetical protein
MSSRNFYSGYPVVAGNKVALFLMYQQAENRTYAKNVSSKVVPCQPNVQSFNDIQFVSELPPCRPSLKELKASQYPLYPSLISSC